MKRLLTGIADRLRQLTGRRPAPPPSPARPSAARPTAARPSAARPSAASTSAASTSAARPSVARPAPPGPPPGRHLAYSPKLDGHADPGEIVWTWVPYEDDPRQGKDRPVLVVGRDGATLLGLMLSSKAERDGQHNWLALGSGAWDREGRPSWLRLDRVLHVDDRGVRREGAVLDRKRFNAVARTLRADYHWR